MSLASASEICALQLRIFFSLGREQLASQDGHALISLNAIEQRIDVNGSSLRYICYLTIPAHSISAGGSHQIHHRFGDEKI
jgi:hypothetical protein